MVEVVFAWVGWRLVLVYKSSLLHSTVVVALDPTDVASLQPRFPCAFVPKLGLGHPVKILSIGLFRLLLDEDERVH